MNQEWMMRTMTKTMRTLNHQMNLRLVSLLKNMTARYPLQPLQVVVNTVVRAKTREAMMSQLLTVVGLLS
ncbi:unnamed protein product [Protopolystoma xenopodis]|uniref:Uncharacterized protein n=1 Tax=Protopolystoma xenopodis TaxID=117903 RepID=A0A448WPY2_9PLAT|nr:unnamed protein product [Protopolystoma xenopodis]